MKKFILSFLAILLVGLFFSSSIVFASGTITIVAAENFYGDVVEELGKPYVQVISIMNNPNQDPHMFNTSPKMAIMIDQADIVIENGLGYDTWMDRLYGASNKKAIMINVGELMDKKPGMNPHIWYDPETMPIFAKTLTEQLFLTDLEHRDIYEKNLANFLKKARVYQKSIARDREKVAGISVTATEPVLGYLVEALGLNMLNQSFQKHMMNETDLTPKEIMQFEDSLNSNLNTKQVKCFIYNAQVIDPTTDNLKKLAIKNHIPVLGVSETMPKNEHYYEWMNRTLDRMMVLLLRTEKV